MSPVLNLTMGITAKIVLVLAIIVYLRPRRSDYISLRYHLIVMKQIKGHPDKTRKLGCLWWPSQLTGNGYLLSNCINERHFFILEISLNSTDNEICNLYAPVMM